MQNKQKTYAVIIFTIVLIAGAMFFREVPFGNEGNRVNSSICSAFWNPLLAFADQQDSNSRYLRTYSRILFLIVFSGVLLGFAKLLPKEHEGYASVKKALPPHIVKLFEVVFWIATVLAIAFTSLCAIGF